MKFITAVLIAGFLTAGEVVLVDSGNGYSMWTQIHECLAFNPIVGGLQFVNRGYDPTGVLNVHQADGGFTFWVHDPVVYDASLGNARYPTSIAATNPLISFVTLDIGSTFLSGVAQYEAGGWYSSFWASPVELASACHKFIGKELPDGNILFIGLGLANEIFYVTTSSDFQTTIASGILGYGNYWGYDINGGIVYVFYYNPTTLNVYYQTTTDGVTWSGEQTYEIPWPNPYTNSILFLNQMAVTDAGDPILVFDVLDDDDTTYPYNSKTYVITESGASPIQVSDDTYDVSWYPTIATGGDYAVVLMHVWTNTLEDSLARHDLFIARSNDNRATWRTPVNITSSFPSRLGLGQIAKRLDTANSQFFYAFAVDMVIDHDPIYHIWLDPEGLDPMAFYVCREDINVGIDETALRPMPNALRSLEIYPNPFSNSIDIRFQMEDVRCKPEDICLKIYDASGRLVRLFDYPFIRLPDQITWHGDDKSGHSVPAGVYFVRFENKETTLVEKIIKLE